MSRDLPPPEDMDWLTVESSLDPWFHYDRLGLYEGPVWRTLCGRWVIQAAAMGESYKNPTCPECLAISHKRPLADPPATG